RIMSGPLRMEYPDAWHHAMNRGRRGDNLEEIGREFNITRFSSVGSVVQRMRGKISGDRRLRIYRGDQNRLTDESSVTLLCQDGDTALEGKAMVGPLKASNA
ncbi:MAG: hypothetical protein R6X27_08955, partial [Candidatus Desulfacyla sp.]